MAHFIEVPTEDRDERYYLNLDYVIRVKIRENEKHNSGKPLVQVKIQGQHMDIKIYNNENGVVDALKEYLMRK